MKNQALATMADRIIDFKRRLVYTGKLPQGFSVLNPYAENPETQIVMEQFYRKYYSDNNPRKFIIGINPSRHGAGVTGVPFTDTKRLKSACGITMNSAYTHEVSSVYIYDVINALGGPAEFFSQYYINSPFPLAIVRLTEQGKWLNANYYDDKKLFEAVKPFMISSLQSHINMGIDTKEVFVLGKKNAEYIALINREEKFFEKISVLDHPRYIQQYKMKDRELYINQYILTLTGNDIP